MSTWKENNIVNGWFTGKKILKEEKNIIFASKIDLARCKWENLLFILIILTKKTFDKLDKVW